MQADVVVIGAGPAGIAAATAAAASGASVSVVDDNFAPGGQIWRNESNPATRRLLSSRASVLAATTIYDAPARGILIGEQRGEPIEIRYGKLVVATGARELFLPFPGWTIPNVFGAGGLQALAKNGLPVAGKRVIVAGSGPLLLAVAAYLRGKGAEVPLVAEQAPFSSLASFGARLLQYPSKARQAALLRWQLRTVEHATSCWPVAAVGDSVLHAVVLSRDGKRQTIQADYLACGFGLVPNTELAELLGCTVAGGRVLVDRFQQTTISGVFAAGEVTGIGGSDLAEAEGAIAGYAATSVTSAAVQRFTARARAQQFAGALNRGFALRPELKGLPTSETVVCRCEDVPWGKLHGLPGWRAAKLNSRCGMGPCQARVCGPVLEFLANWQRVGVRPPLYPVPLRCLARDQSEAGAV